MLPEGSLGFPEFTPFYTTRRRVALPILTAGCSTIELLEQRIVGRLGLEPRTFGLKARYSTELS